MTIDCIDEIPGAAALRDWYGGVPSFHDGYMNLVINSDGTGLLQAFGWHMTDKTDANGYFILEKHFGATLHIEELVSASLNDFLPGAVILGGLDIFKEGDVFKVDFSDTAYGMSGHLIAKKLKLEYEPGGKVS